MLKCRNYNCNFIVKNQQGLNKHHHICQYSLSFEKQFRQPKGFEQTLKHGLYKNNSSIHVIEFDWKYLSIRNKSLGKSITISNNKLLLLVSESVYKKTVVHSHQKTKKFNPQRVTYQIFYSSSKNCFYAIALQEFKKLIKIS